MARRRGGSGSGSSQTSKGLDALSQVRADLQAEAAAREREEALAAERAARAAAERHIFARTVGPVAPVPKGLRQRVWHERERPSPHPRQREADEKAALAEALSDEVDIHTLLLTDDELAYRRAEVAPSTVDKLRKGHWAIQAHLDLHGLRRDEAREALAQFIRHCVQRGERCVRIVHGKGHGSPGRVPILKAKAQRWLAQHQAVLAFAQAKASDGGAGALVVLLNA